MSEINLSKEDKEIANTLQKIMGGDEDDFYENTRISDTHTNNIGMDTGTIGGERQIATSSVGKTLADGNDLRRLLSDLLDLE